jgi:FMN phosphatase YigB (HAD superfamily)
VKGAVDLLKWGWHNGRREQIFMMALAFVGNIVTWVVWTWLGFFVTIIAVAYSVAWGRGHRRGWLQAMTLATDHRIAEMEAVQEAMLEELAPDHPMRRAAHAELVNLRRYRETLD